MQAIVVAGAVVLLVLSGCGEPDDPQGLEVEVLSDVCMGDDCLKVPIEGVELTLILSGRSAGTSVTDDAGRARFTTPAGSAQGEVQVTSTPLPNYPKDPISVPVTVSDGGLLSVTVRLPRLAATLAP